MPVQPCSQQIQFLRHQIIANKTTQHSSPIPSSDGSLPIVFHGPPISSSMAPNARGPRRKVSHKKKKTKREDATNTLRAIKGAEKAARKTESVLISPDRQRLNSCSQSGNKGTAALFSFRQKVNLTKPVILDNTKLLVWARDPFLADGSQTATAVKRQHAINDFKTMRYAKKLKVAPGQSSQIAASSFAESKLSSIVKTKLTGASTSPIMTTKFSHLRRYLLEDLLVSSTGHAVVICVAPNHPSYATFASLEARSHIKIPKRVIGKQTYHGTNNIDNVAL